MRRVDPPVAALHRMEPQGTVQSLPEVAVADRHHLSEPLPAPAVIAPFGQPVVDAPTHVVATADQRDASGLVDRLQAADHRQQVEPFPPNVRLVVFRLKPPRAVRRAE